MLRFVLGFALALSTCAMAAPAFAIEGLSTRTLRTQSDMSACVRRVRQALNRVKRRYGSGNVSMSRVDGVLFRVDGGRAALLIRCVGRNPTHAVAVAVNGSSRYRGRILDYVEDVF